MRTVAVLVGALVCAACALEHRDPAVIRDVVEAARVVDESNERAVLLAAAALEVLDFELFEVGSHHVRAKAREMAVPEFCTCGTFRGASVSRKVVGVLLVEVGEAPDGACRVDVRNECSYASVEGRVACTTSGIVELDFWDEFNALLAAPEPVDAR